MMPKRYKYNKNRKYYYKTLKYSNETYSSQMEIQNNDGETGSHGKGYLALVPPTDTLGTRKMKNFTLQILPGETKIGEDDASASLAFALVFVPEGTLPSQITLGTGAMPLAFYQPNQNVILQGFVDNSRAYTFRSYLSRNLNSGDSIFLVLYDLTPKPEGNGVTTSVAFSLNYAIGY